MSTTTTNYGLLKPELTDVADITAMNLNWDTIDTKLKDLENADSTATTKLNSHTTNKSNPHEVTKAQVGLGNVPNVVTNDQAPTYTAASTLATLTSGEKLSVSMGKIMKAITDLISHIGNNSNPHRVTASQVGSIAATEKGAASGVASLDSKGKVPSSQLPTMDYAPSTHASQHASGGSDPITPANIGAAALFGPVTISVPTASWSGSGPWTQTITVSGVTASDNHIGIFPVDIADSDARKLYEKAYGCLAAEAETVDGGITLTCRDAKPEIDFNIIVKGAK